MIILAATQPQVEASPGWGKLIALVVAILLFWVGKSAFERYKGEQDEGHSPADGRPAVDGVKQQVADTADTKLTPQGSARAAAGDDLELFVQKHAGQLRTKDIVRQAAAQFQASKSTVMRRLREAKRRKEYGS